MDAELYLSGAIKRVTQAATDKAEPSERAARYVELSDAMLAVGRIDEAVTAMLAAAKYAAPLLKQDYLARAKHLADQISDPHGILQEHRSYVAHQARYSAYPSFVRIETLATCNASCIFCPYPKLERKGTRMSDELLDKILSDLTDIPSEHTFGISFHHISEPLIDKRFQYLVEWAQKHLPNCYVIVNTNGSALNSQNIAFLLDARNIREINVSFNDHRASEYEFSMGLRYDRTLANIDSLHERLTAGGQAKKIIVRRVGDGSTDDSDFVDFCKDRWPRFTSVSRTVKDFLGQIKVGPSGKPIQELSYSEVPVSGCLQWYQMTITSEGKVAVCCFDGNGEWIIGDVTGRHILDVYNSEGMKEFRERSVTRLDAPEPCRSCTIFWSGRKMNPSLFVPTSENSSLPA